MSGTSMAAPIVSGLAALLKSVAMKSKYDLPARELKDIIIKSAVPFSNGDKYTMSGGRADALAAVRLLKAKIKMNGMVKNTGGDVGDVGGDGNDNGDGNGNVGVGGADAPAGARQSSTYGKHVASNAMSTTSGYNARKYPQACSMTDPKRSHAWWTVGIGNASRSVSSVSITARGDCCWSKLKGAKVMVGDTPWTGSGSASQYTTCGVVGNVVRGGRGVNVVTCGEGVSGKYVAVYLPKRKTSLMLCGVEVK